VGVYRDGNGTPHAFLLDNGGYTTLDVPGSTGYLGTFAANGINDAGQIVGG
jgi:hypothetical protein